MALRFHIVEVSRAPCPPAASMQAARSLVGTAHERFAVARGCAGAFAHPTRSGMSCAESNNIGPCLRLRARGSPSFLSLFRLPRKSRGSARRQGAVPGLLRAGVRIAPDDEVLCAAPRASRRANKHLRAYALPTTRTGQDLFVPGRFARVPPVGKVASTSPAGALPLPALTNASGRRPS